MTIAKLRILAETTVNDYPDASLQRFINDGVKEADELKSKLEFISNWLCENAQYKDFKEIVDWGKSTDKLLATLKVEISMDVEKVLFESLDNALVNSPELFKLSATEIASDVIHHDSQFDSYLPEDLDGYVGEYLFEMGEQIDDALNNFTQK